MKKLVKLVAMLFVALYIAVYIIFFFPQTGNQPHDNKKAAIVAELWNIDIFEGGSGSRGEFLKSQTIAFEKNNSGCFMLVKDMTYQQMLYSLAEGRYPDMFSYGAGIAFDILADLRAISCNFEGYENIINSGAVEDKVFAAPWCCGGYIIAGIRQYLSEQDSDFSLLLANSHKQSGKNSIYSFTVGYAPFNNPFLAAFSANNNLTLEEKSMYKGINYTQYEAYSKFVSKNASVFLLGTQRDAVRLSGRENASDFTMQAVKGFSDIVCYASICKHTQAYELCNNFIEYLLSETVQRKLNKINMFSVNTEGLYKEGIMHDIEKEVSAYTVLNAFISKEILANNRDTALKALSGDQDAAKKIREMLPNHLN